MPELGTNTRSVAVWRRLLFASLQSFSSMMVAMLRLSGVAFAGFCAQKSKVSSAVWTALGDTKQ